MTCVAGCATSFAGAEADEGLRNLGGVNAEDKVTSGATVGAALRAAAFGQRSRSRADEPMSREGVLASTFPGPALRLAGSSRGAGARGVAAPGTRLTGG